MKLPNSLIQPAATAVTAQFADISVGSGRAMFKGWNTVIVRTGAGADLIEVAKKNGMLEIQPLPEENLTHLKKAALIKLKKAIKKITERTGSEQDFGYLKVRAEVAEALLEE